MLKRHKDLLRAVVAPLRATLAGVELPDGTRQRGDLDRELERLGIAEDGALTPLDALPGASPAERRAHYAAEAAIGQAVNGQQGAEAAERRRAARAEVVERAAYTWINRLLALRAMEARGLIDETLRATPDYQGLSEALFVLRSSAPDRAAGADGGWWAVLEDACEAQAAALPGLFDLADPAAALRPSTPALLRCVALVGAPPAGPANYTLEEADAAFADPDAIGWAYQFYQEAAKAAVYKKLGAGGKAGSRAEIAAATQLFTEPYMVQWLLQNSLGRCYHEAHPDTRLPDGWDYYIRQRPAGQRPPEHPRPLHALDLIDPCCGSGHFLREAFDMFAAMYRERHPDLDAAEIADRILARHLHGIDLDPRAAQLAALTLFLRAWEFVRAEARRLRRPPPVYRPAALHIATTPSGLSAGALERHLRRHPEDRVMQPLLEGVFAALEQADILGSLLRPSEHLDAAIRALQRPHTIRMDFDADDAALRGTITALAQSDPAELKRMLLERVAASFRAEAGSADDVAAQLFGREAEGGLRLLQLLDRKYTVVVTNPPYMGSKNMDVPLKKFVEVTYPQGKRDLYASFILQCLQMCQNSGRLAMVTMHGWMFQRSYSLLRSGSANSEKGLDFGGLIQLYNFEILAHLGSNSFEEISGEVVQNVLFIVRNEKPGVENKMQFSRLIGLKDPIEKSKKLKSVNILKLSQVDTNRFLQIPEMPMVYWVPDRILKLLSSDRLISNMADVRQGVRPADVNRSIRQVHEIDISKINIHWYKYVRGGGYRKWDGLNETVIDWQYNGSRLKELKSIVPSEQRYFQSGLTFTDVAQGSMSTRLMESLCIFSDSGPALFSWSDDNKSILLGILNSRLITYLLRVTSPSSLHFRMGYVANLPYPNREFQEFGVIVNMCVEIKKSETLLRLQEFNFVSVDNFRICLQSVLLLLEAYLDTVIFLIYELTEVERDEVYLETGTPAGFHPLLAGYDALPELPAELELPALPGDVLDHLAAHARISPPPAELARIKARLRALYEAGRKGRRRRPRRGRGGRRGRRGRGRAVGRAHPHPDRDLSGRAVGQDRAAPDQRLLVAGRAAGRRGALQARGAPAAGGPAERAGAAAAGAPLAAPDRGR